MNFVTKTQLQDIVEYISDSIHVPQLVQHFNKDNIYSTDERLVGCWIDGRPIYQKTIIDTMPVITTNGTEISKEISIGATVDTIVDSNIFIKNTTGTTIKATTFVADPNNHFRYTIINNTDSTASRRNKIYVVGSYASWSEKPLYITLKYTKTTDAANSFNLADENDYSTTEKIVGTWIDGKPVYQKTIVFGALPNNDVKSVNHGISNINLIVKWNGIFNMASSTINGPLPNVSNPKATSNWDVDLQADNTKITINTAADCSAINAYITIQYTKTTD